MIGRLTYPQPRPETRAQLERAGLAEPRVHLYRNAVLVPRYRETIAIETSVPATSSDRNSSRLIHQPFRVDALNIVSDDFANNGSVIVGYDQTATDGVGGADRAARPIWSGTNDGLLGGETAAASTSGLVTPGTIFRNTPGRLFLTVSNTTAATHLYTAYISVTYLAPPDPEPEPDALI